MLQVRPGADPYIFYKMHHIHRAQAAWTLSDQLGLFEALRDEPATPEQLAERIGIKPHYAAALLSAGSCIGILDVQDGVYSIYPIMREMVLEGGRARVKPRVPDEDDEWYHSTRRAVEQGFPDEESIPDWVRDPKGMDPDATAFSPGRDGWRILWGEALADAFDFTPYRCVLDVGAATGGVLVGLTGKVPGLKGITMDLPYSQATAEKALEFNEATDRVSFFAADFFEDPYPEGVDVIFMSHILHDWNDEDCLRLLRRCHDALPEGSPLLAQEFLLDDDKTGQILGVFQWFGMLSGTTGLQRTAGEIETLLAETGFASTETRRVDEEQSIVIGWK